jgi:hypothetical protein
MYIFDDVKLSPGQSMLSCIDLKDAYGNIWQLRVTLYLISLIYLINRLSEYILSLHSCMKLFNSPLGSMTMTATR